MVASRYHLNHAERLNWLRDEMNLRIAQKGCLTPAIFTLNENGIGFIPVPYTNPLAVMLSEVKRGSTAVAYLSMGTTDGSNRSARIYYVTSECGFGFEMQLDMSSGWPVLGEWRPIECMKPFLEVFNVERKK